MKWLKAFLLFIGAAVRVGARAGEKTLGTGAGQKRTGSVTLRID